MDWIAGAGNQKMLDLFYKDFNMADVETFFSFLDRRAIQEDERPVVLSAE
jgi:hypothetical protein